VEHETCAQCGFDGALFSDGALLEALRALGPRWRVLLDGAGDELRARPAPQTWSAIEYVAHSRDITALHVYGVERALTEHEPVLPPIADDFADAVASSYGDEDAAAVVDALDAHARRIADLAEEADTSSWNRGITVGTDRIEVRRLLEHALHDSTHHLEDVESGFVAVRRASQS
jgi:hypothetical protein